MSTLQSFVGYRPSQAVRIRNRILPFVLFALLLLILPVFGFSRGTLTLINHIGINIVFVLSYNMLLGRAGLLSFGHAVYFGLAGFYCMHVMNWIGAGEGIWAAIPVVSLPLFGFAIGALIGVVLGYPSCRRAGTAFAMISLGLAELISSGAVLFEGAFGGEMGVSADRTAGPEVFGMSLGSVEQVYWFIAFWTFAAMVAMYAFTRTPLGRMSEAARDNPLRVEFVGYDANRIRYLVFILSAGFAGLAGGMSAVQDEIFTIDTLGFVPSGVVLIAAFIGGTRHFAGPVLGAIVLTLMQTIMAEASAAWLLYLGLVFIVMVRFAPEGIAGLIVGGWGKLRDQTADRLLLQATLLIAGIATLGLAVVLTTEVAMRWSEGYGEVFQLFGLAFPYGEARTWAIITAMALTGALCLRGLNLSQRA